MPKIPKHPTARDKPPKPPGVENYYRVLNGSVMIFRLDTLGNWRPTDATFGEVIPDVAFRAVSTDVSTSLEHYYLAHGWIELAN